MPCALERCLVSETEAEVLTQLQAKKSACERLSMPSMITTAQGVDGGRPSQCCSYASKACEAEAQTKSKSCRLAIAHPLVIGLKQQLVVGGACDGVCVCIYIYMRCATAIGPAWTNLAVSVRARQPRSNCKFGTGRCPRLLLGREKARLGISSFGPFCVYNDKLVCNRGRRISSAACRALA